MTIHSLCLNDGTVISENSPVFIVAEIGQNHQGDVDIAKNLIRSAKECQANCVKFQKSCLNSKFTKDALDSPYSSPHSWGNTYGEHKEHLEFSEEEYYELQKYSSEIGILFTASAMDITSLHFLKKLNPPFIKIGSGDSTNILLLAEAADIRKPLVISTGMCSMEDVEAIYNTIIKKHNNFALLQCVSSYPTSPKDANLGVISKLKSKFDVQIGYSGHEIGFNITLAAVALGAKIVERHITLDKTWKGNDHACSLDVEEFGKMVQAVREIEEGLGFEKAFLPCEMGCWKKLGKSIVAKCDINEDYVIKESDLTIKVSKPQGTPAKYLKNIIGRTTKRKISVDSPILKDDLN